MPGTLKPRSRIHDLLSRRNSLKPPSSEMLSASLQHLESLRLKEGDNIPYPELIAQFKASLDFYHASLSNRMRSFQMLDIRQSLLHCECMFKILEHRQVLPDVTFDVTLKTSINRQLYNYVYNANNAFILRGMDPPSNYVLQQDIYYFMHQRIISE